MIGLISARTPSQSRALDALMRPLKTRWIVTMSASQNSSFFETSVAPVASALPPPYGRRAAACIPQFVGPLYNPRLAPGTAIYSGQPGTTNLAKRREDLASDANALTHGDYVLACYFGGADIASCTGTQPRPAAGNDADRMETSLECGWRFACAGRIDGTNRRPRC